MRVGLFLISLVVLGGFVENTSHAQQAPKAVAKPVAKPAPAGSAGPAKSQRGTVGGPANKSSGISGTGSRPKH